jgi:acetyl esterase
MAKLHDQAAALVANIQEQGVPRVREAASLEQAREITGMIGEILGAGPEVASVRDLEIPVGDAVLAARLYEPVEDAVDGLMVYFFGGGWVVGGPFDFDAMYRKLANASGCRLLSVGYRLAPEHPFPTAVEDCEAAVRWAADELAYGQPIVIAGDSSGGNLAAVTARRLRDAGSSPISYQLLIYPVADHDFDRPSYHEHTDLRLLLDRDDMIWFWERYLPDEQGRDHADASPLKGDSLEGLPPAYVVIAEFDPLRDEDRAYADALAAAGVPVQVDFVDDQLHGFFAMVNLMESADAAVERAGRAIREALAVETRR